MGYIWKAKLIPFGSTLRGIASHQDSGDRKWRWRPQMVLPEEMPVTRKPQILDDEDRVKATIESLERENRSLKDLVIQLSTLVIRRVTGKK
jgi:hypothetical protein